MNDTAGMIKPDIQELPQIPDRMTFLYLERCKINRQDSAVTVLDEKGITYIPSGNISVLLLGPGTEITIPVAFEIASCETEDISGTVRRRVRDEMTKAHILERMVRDIKYLLVPEDNYDEDKTIYLWDDKKNTVDSGKQYGFGKEL